MRRSSIRQQHQQGRLLREQLSGGNNYTSIAAAMDHAEPPVRAPLSIEEADARDGLLRDPSVEEEEEGNASSSSRPWQVLAVASYLVFWVANAEVVQGISTGTILGDHQEGYNKPAFISWSSYNFMMISLFLVAWHVSKREHLQRVASGNSFTRLVSAFWDYLTRVWCGNLPWLHCVAACTVVAYALQILNIFFILGLECISVPLVNAVYQSQTIFTVALSACLLQDGRITCAEWIGLIVSAVGIMMIVLPPVLTSKQDIDEVDQEYEGVCMFAASSPILGGIVMILMSALIGGAYYVGWRVFSERRFGQAPTKWQGFLDAHMTLGMIGVTNLLFGWPLVLILHVAKWEIFEWPGDHSSGNLWSWLTWNGLVEYAFDSCCAMAIYLTSPIVAAVVAPLTIPLSFLLDPRFPTAGDDAVADPPPTPLAWVGCLVVLLGVLLLEVPLAEWIHGKKTEKTKDSLMENGYLGEGDHRVE